MASQLHSGLEGVAARLPLGPSADDPYTTDAGRLPVNLAAAIARFEQTVTDWEQREYFDLY
jgi:glutamine synthetase